MTDFEAADDEVVSAYIDGEATADEVALVEADPRLQARAEELRRATSSLRSTAGGAPLAIDDADRERAIAAALAAAEADNDGAGGIGGMGGVDRDDLAARRAARSSRRFRVVSIAAAVALILVAGTAIVSRFNRGGGDTFAASTTQDDDATREGAAAGDGGAAAAGGAEMTTAPSALAALGAFGSEDDLVRAVSAGLEGRSAATTMAGPATSASPPGGGVAGSPTTTTAPQTAPYSPDGSSAGSATDNASGAGAGGSADEALGCANQLKDDGVETGDLIYAADATYQGAPVHVFVFERATSGAAAGTGAGAERHLWVVATDCSTVFTRLL